MHESIPASEISRSLHRGLEHGDIPTMMSLFDDNAELQIIDKDHTPSRPMTLSGRSSLERHFHDVLTRPTKHHVGDEAMSDNHYAYTETCEYPDGSKVFSSVMATLKDGKIVKEVEVQAWDENA
jgi:hypothetical protein